MSNDDRFKDIETIKKTFPKNKNYDDEQIIIVGGSEDL